MTGALASARETREQSRALAGLKEERRARYWNWPRDYLLVTNGIVGTAGFGNHKHNDLLGFEYHVDGVPVLVDPGSEFIIAQAMGKSTPPGLWSGFHWFYGAYKGHQINDDL